MTAGDFSQKLGLSSQVYRPQLQVNDAAAQVDLHSEIGKLDNILPADLAILTLLHSERPKLYTIVAFLSAIGLYILG